MQTPMQMLDGLRIQSLSPGSSFAIWKSHLTAFQSPKHQRNRNIYQRSAQLRRHSWKFDDLDTDNVVQLSQLDTDKERISIDLWRGSTCDHIVARQPQASGFVGEVGIDPGRRR